MKAKTNGPVLQEEKKISDAQERLDRAGSAMDALATISLAKDLAYLGGIAFDSQKNFSARVKAASSSVQISKYIPGNLEAVCEKNGFTSLQNFFKYLTKRIEPVSDAAKMLACLAKVYVTIVEGKHLTYDGAVTISSCFRDFSITANKVLAKNNMPTFNDALEGASSAVQNVAGKMIDVAVIGKAAYYFNELKKSVEDLKEPKGMFDVAAKMGKIEINRREIKSQLKAPATTPALKSIAPLQEERQIVSAL
jgi:hypothetical protein